MVSTNVNQSMMIAKNAHAYVNTSLFHESALKIFPEKSFQNFLPRGNSFNFEEKYKPLLNGLIIFNGHHQRYLKI